MKFSFKTITDFDNHIDKSIHHYELLHKSILNISTYFIKSNSTCVDIGCTSGNLLNNIIDRNVNVNAIGVDIEDSNLVDIKFNYINTDITTWDWNIYKSDFITSIFTIQFIKPELKLQVLQNIYDNLNLGGGFILCEKIYQNTGIYQEIFNFAHYDYKGENFTSNEILDKQKDLRNIMFPQTEEEIMKDLHTVGFKKIEPFFQSLNFKGWLIIK